MEQWDHTASILVVYANCHRDPEKKKRPYELHDFHPFRDRDPRSGGGGIRICKDNRDVLKKVFAARNKGTPKRISNAHGQTSHQSGTRIRPAQIAKPGP